MKKLCFLALLMGLLVFSCSREDLLNTGQESDRYADASLKSAGPVFEVADLSDDDTEELLEAFALAQEAGKGAVVKLLPGTFEIGMIEIREFYGSLIGSGKGTSIVTGLPDLLPDDALAANKLPALITFVGGDVTVADLSVNLTERYSWLGEYPLNMLLFSDYTVEFVPAVQKIRVKMNNVEVTGLPEEDVELWPGGPVIDFTYYGLVGVKIAPDVYQPSGEGTLPRTSADAFVTNSSFAAFDQGFVVWGCKRGDLNFGQNGGNTFSGNNQGLVINEDVGVNVKIWNNTFNVPDWYWNGIDVNTIDEPFFERVSANPGNYDIRYNTFNINYSNGYGVWDIWPYDHPEHPQSIQMIWDKNTFNCLANDAQVGVDFNLVNAVFSNNTINGEVELAWWAHTGTYWIPPEDPKFELSMSTGCKLLNNHFLQDNVILFLDWDTKDYLVQGGLSNVDIWDFGVSNKIIGKTNPNHARGTLPKELWDRLEQMRQKYTE